VSGGLFNTGPAEVQEFQGTYYAYSRYPDTRPAGNYTGDVTLQICEDASCAAAYALPRASVPYQVDIFHVQAGLPALTATFTLDDVAVTGATAGLDASGQRTYALDVQVGQVLDVLLSDNPRSIYRGGPGDTATLARLDSTYPVMRYQPSLPFGATSGVASLRFRVEDGRWMYLTLHVTP